MSGLAVLLGQGFLLGLAIAAPVGPLAFLCMRASLAHGFGAGVTGGLGVAAGDALYAALAAFGVTALAGLLAGIELWLGLAGGAFLVWLGVATMRRAPATADPARPRRGALASFTTTFLLTLANPPTIMFFAAMFAGLGVAGRSHGGTGALALVAGVFLGSLAWWLALAAVVSRARARLAGPALVWINRVSGAVLLAFGLWAIVRALGPS